MAKNDSPIESKHNLIIECGPASSDELRRHWQRVANGIADMNAEYFADHPDKIDMPLPRYETPREAGGIADQRVGNAWVVRRRGKATCVEWAAYCCGAMRVRGTPCDVVLVEARSMKYNKPIPYSYHALVEAVDPETGETRRIDVTADLPGYHQASMGHPDDPWWIRLGHCCEDCALGEHGKETPCEECAVTGAAEAVCTKCQLTEKFGTHTYRRFQ